MMIKFSGWIFASNLRMWPKLGLSLVAMKSGKAISVLCVKESNFKIC